MAEVILSSDELTVLGGPTEISVDVDFGPQGDRGSLILYGLGKPTEVQLPEVPRVYDSYINLLTSDDEYRSMYQYIAGDGGTLTWVRLFKLTPNIYSENLQRSFTNGSVSVSIPLAAIVASDPQDSQEFLGNPQAENFNIQCNVLGTNPVSLAVSVSEIEISNNLTSLPITISGIEYVSGEWQPLSGPKTVHLLITVV